MAEFIIHQHHNYGWTKNVHQAASFDEAALTDLLKYHDWLPQYGYKVIFHPTHYEVGYDGEPYPPCFYGTPYWARMGNHWFGERLHQGNMDDCDKCGGTGVNHYNPFVQCWSCGDGKTVGKSSGKLLKEEVGE